jgi:signal peptidase I
MMKKQVDIKTEKKAIQEPSLAQDIIQLLLKIAIIIFAIILIFTFLYGIVRINDVSMKPAIKDGDLVMYYRLDKRFVSGDIAVFKKNDRITTGRVVAVASDTVDITKDGLMINGATQISQDIYFDTTQFKDGVDFPITVGEGQLFILGDNRPQASDSRTFGCIDLNDVKGKVIAVIRTRGI